MRSYIYLLITLLFLSHSSIAQNFKHDVFMVSLTDKTDSPYSLLHPQDYLSPRAIERRQQQQISIDEYDLPVNPNYIEQILDLGVELQHQSKWLNALAIYVEDTTVLDKIQNLPFVVEIQPLGKRKAAKEAKFFDHFPEEEYEKDENFYGVTFNQVAMLGGHLLHNLGHRGGQKRVAIFDGGFINVYRMPAFDSLFARNKILGTRDFVERDEFVYEGSTHGTNVLSCMAANLPYLVMGTAPDAAYYLFKTEDVGGEFRIEEFNWVAAAEYADSLGVDVINSSLGYTGFNDKSMSYEYKDLDGETAICTRGADIAVTRGMLVVNSAGNEGNGEWHYIGAPADGHNVISVGAVRANGEKAGFSSFGPTADGRIKPNISAQGHRARVASFRGYKVSSTNGTSFSSPIMAGMVTTLWGAFPDKSNWEIKDAIEAAGHQTAQPDSALGYGIPDFFRAYVSLMEAGFIVDDASGLSFGLPAVVDDQIDVMVQAAEAKAVKFTVFDKLERPVYEYETSIKALELLRLDLPILQELEDGVYGLRIDVGINRYYSKMVKASKLDPQ
jgi:serine protease AprX